MTRGPFDDYFEAYVQLHAGARIRQVHFAASSAAVGSIVLGLLTRRLTPFLAAPLLLSIPTWILRRAAGDGALPPSATPVRHAALAAFEMWRRELDGTLDAEVARVTQRREREQRAARRAERRREAEVAPVPNMMTDDTLH